MPKNTKKVTVEDLKNVRKRLDERYLHKDEYAKGLQTDRTIDDLDVSCPPITYGIAGGDAEIATGPQELKTLYGNTVQIGNKFVSVKSARLIARGKNQFVGFDLFTDVVEGEEYILNCDIISEFNICEYDSEFDEVNDYDIESGEQFHIGSTCRYIKITVKNQEDVVKKSDAKVMLYNTFGESYVEPYEEPFYDDLDLPNIELHSIGNVRDEIYRTGGGIRRIGVLELTEGAFDPDTLMSTVTTTNTTFYVVGIPIVMEDSAYRPDSNHSLEFYYDAVSHKFYLEFYKLNNEDYYDIVTSAEDKAECLSLLYASGGKIIYVLDTPQEITDQENPGWDDDIIIDNWGTLLFLDENDDVIAVPQPYEIVYTVDLKEFLDSTYAKAKGNASDIALESDLEEGNVVVGLAEDIHTDRTIDDLDVSCPPITYGIAGGDAEISTGVQELTTLFGNTVYDEDNNVYKSVKSAKLVSRGKNQWKGWGVLTDVVGGEEYKIFGCQRGFIILEIRDDGYYWNKQSNVWYDPNGVVSSAPSVTPDGTSFVLQNDTRYIKISVVDPAEIEDDNVMFYNTFGESYAEPYEEPRVESINLPNIELRNIGNVRDEIYSSGGGIRRIGCLVIDENSTIDSAGGNSMQHGYAIKDLQLPQGYDIYKILIEVHGNLLNDEYFNGFRNDDGYITFDISEDSPYSMSDIIYGTKIFFIYEDCDLEPQPITEEENPGWDPKIFIDNYGTLMFQDSEGNEIDVEQPYEIIYKVNLKEFLDSSYARTDGDASDLALVSELENGDVVPAHSVEAEALTPYSEDSGFTQDHEFSYQTTAAGSDCGENAQILSIKGKSFMYAYFTVNNDNDLYNDISEVIVAGSHDDYYELDCNENGDSEDPNFNFNITLEETTVKDTCLAIIEVDNLGSFFEPGSYTYIDEETDEEKEVTTGVWIEGNRITGPGTYYAIVSGFRYDKPSLHVKCVRANNDSDNETFMSVRIRYINLTTIYGQGREPSTVDDVKELIPSLIVPSRNKDLVSIYPSKFVATGYNQNDEIYEQGDINWTDGSDADDNSFFHSVNHLKCLPNTEYGIVTNNNLAVSILFYDINKHYLGYNSNVDGKLSGEFFTTPQKARYMRLEVSTISSEDDIAKAKICVFLAWDHSKITYEPYETHEYNLFTDYELLGIDDYTYDEYIIEPDVITYAQRVLIKNRYELVSNYYDSSEDEISIAFSSIGWHEVHKFKLYFDGKDVTNDVIVSVDENKLTLFSNVGADYAEILSDSTLKIIFLYELEEPEEEYDTKLGDYHIIVNDFGTTEFVDLNEGFFIPYPATMKYEGDYVAFVDSVATRTNYDPDVIAYKDDPEFAEMFEDDEFITNAGKIKPGTGPVVVLQHATNHAGIRSSWNKIRRDGSKFRMNITKYYGTKKCNMYPEGNQLIIMHNEIDTDDLIKLAVKNYFDFNDLEDCSHTYPLSDHLLTGCGIRRDFAKTIKKEIFKNVCKSDCDIYVYCSDANVDSGDYMDSNGIEVDFEEVSANYNTLMLGSFNRHYIHETAPDRYTFRPTVKRLFKFVKNYSGRYSEKWSGTIANLGYEVRLYSVMDWDTEMYCHFVIGQFIKLK